MTRSVALAAKDPTNVDAVRDIVNLIHELADVTGTWLITTSRESLPGSSDNEEMRIHSLEQPDARELLANVLREKGIEPPYERKAAEEMEQAITSLIEAVRGHARSLVLLGPNIAGRGIEATREAIRREMVALEKRHPGNREKSLLASVRVSLNRLDPAMRAKIAPLCVFRQAAPLMLLPFVLEVEPHEIIEAIEKLVELGLAQMSGSYLLPDPALSEALAFEMDPPEHQAAETRWCRGMHSFAHFLSEQQGQNARIARHGTAVALIDLLDALEITFRGVQAGTVSADVGAIFATCLEYLVTMVGHPRAAARIISAREMLASMLPEWGPARFMTEAAEIDRCIEAGNMNRAFELALRLRDNADAAADAYPDATYDRAEAMCRLGDVLQRMGRAQEAMPILFTVLSQVRHLKMNGSTQASMLEGFVHTKLGDALYKIGQHDYAAAMYEEAVKLDRARGDIRSVVVSLGQLAHVRFLQRRFDDALKAYSDVRGQFEQIGEPAGIATANYNIANIYTQLGDYHRAEVAHKESLRIKVALGDQWGEAASLGELGTLYFVQEREQEAVTLYRQAMALYEELGDVGGVARQATNLGRAFQELRRFDEAREVLLIATNLDAKLGEVAERWKAWAILSAVERDAGRTDAATHARVCTMKAYCDYRRAGGEAVDLQARFAQDVCEALQHGGQDAVAELLQDLRTMDSEETPDRLALLKVLEQVLAGNRNIDLTNDPSLDPIAAAELQFQLEVFSGEG